MLEQLGCDVLIAGVGHRDVRESRSISGQISR